jgi:hypothetical protein
MAPVVRYTPPAMIAANTLGVYPNRNSTAVICFFGGGASPLSVGLVPAEEGELILKEKTKGYEKTLTLR